MLPSLKKGTNNQKPRILVLEVRGKDQPDGKPIAWLLVERTEQYERDSKTNCIINASIQLSYVQILPYFNSQQIQKGEFFGSYSAFYNRVSLTASSIKSGFVTLDLQDLEGQRIGTYFMNEVVEWVQSWPDAIVNTIKLEISQATPANKERRNRFYERFGLIFDYLDNDKEMGESREIRAGDLNSVKTWQENITEHSLLDYINKLLISNQTAKTELTIQERFYKDQLVTLKRAEEHPYLWLLQKMF